MKQYDIVTQKITKLDEISLQVKGWTVTLWTAITGWGVVQQNDGLVLIAVPATLGLWSVEVLNRYFQEQFMEMSRQLESALEVGAISVEDLTNASIRVNVKGFEIREAETHAGGIIRREMNSYLKRVFQKQWLHYFHSTLFAITLILYTILHLSTSLQKP